VASNDSRSPKVKEFWNYLEENYREVSSWPTWMRGESASCNGDNSVAPVQEPERDVEDH
jgi:hypothetical protein